MKARIYKSTGSWYTVKLENGQFCQARIKGVIKLDAITSTNPIAVGDWVDCSMEEDAEQAVMIHTIIERDNYVARQSPHNKRQQHIIASNMDQSILLATLKSPKTSQGFIDRFLVSCEAFHIPAIIVFNKADTVSYMRDLAPFEEVGTALEFDFANALRKTTMLFHAVSEPRGDTCRIIIEGEGKGANLRIHRFKFQPSRDWHCRRYPENVA